MSLREHVSLREHACVSSRGAQSTELVSLYIGYWTLNNYYYYPLRCPFMNRNVINSADVYGRLATQTGNEDHIAGNWMINQICTPLHMLYLFGPEPQSHTPHLYQK